jgi:hypothetical protein
LVSCFYNHDWHFMQSGFLRRAPSPFTSDQLIVSWLTPQDANDDGLNKALSANRISKFIELSVVECPTRVSRVRRDQANGYASDSAIRDSIGRGIAQKRSQASSQPWPIFVRH